MAIARLKHYLDPVTGRQYYRTEIKVSESDNEWVPLYFPLNAVQGQTQSCEWLMSEHTIAVIALDAWAEQEKTKESKKLSLEPDYIVEVKEKPRLNQCEHNWLPKLNNFGHSFLVEAIDLSKEKFYKICIKCNKEEIAIDEVVDPEKCNHQWVNSSRKIKDIPLLRWCKLCKIGEDLDETDSKDCIHIWLSYPGNGIEGHPDSWRFCNICDKGKGKGAYYCDSFNHGWPIGLNNEVFCIF